LIKPNIRSTSRVIWSYAYLVFDRPTKASSRRLGNSQASDANWGDPSLLFLFWADF